MFELHKNWQSIVFDITSYNKLKIYYFPFRFFGKIINTYFKNLKVVSTIKIVQLK